MSGSMRGMWKRRYGRATKAPPDERGGNRHARPTATAPHPDSTLLLITGPNFSTQDRRSRKKCRAPFGEEFLDGTIELSVKRRYSQTACWMITGRKRYEQHNRALVPPARRQRGRYCKMVGWIAGARMYCGVPSTTKARFLT